MGDNEFRQQLRELLDQRGWSLPQLATRTGYSRGYLWEILSGRGGKTPSPELIQDIDDALGAGGALITAGGDMHRRDLLRDAGAMALLAPLSQTEVVRQGLGAAIGGPATVDQWEEVVADYARTFYLTPPAELLRDLLSDMVVLQHQLHAAGDEGRKPLSRHAGMLAAITAMTWASQAEWRQARRWWQTARHAADTSEDARARVWVRAWEVTNGTYEKRPLRQIVDRATEARQIAKGRVDAGVAGLHAGLAQTLAVAGDQAGALDALGQVRAITDKIPDDVAADTDSMLGWPAVRLHHTSSYVHTTLGSTADAYAAQDAALDSYAPELERERAALLLHRARCMIIDGRTTEGVAYAQGVVDALPPEHRSALVFAVARDTLGAVAPTSSAASAAAALEQHLVVPALDAP